MPEIHYPETRNEDVVDVMFGENVPDPYRWLENDVRHDAEVAAWVAAQNEVTGAYLRDLPGRGILQQRLTALFDYERLTVPAKRGDRYFYTRNAGLENQASLYVRDGLQGPERLLIDPNAWSADGATALAEWAVSEDGALVAYSVQEGGSDWRTIRVLDVATGETLPDRVEWARFTTIAWNRDGSGFFYARYPEPAGDSAFVGSIENHTIHYHALGTTQAEDRLLYATPEQPALFHGFGLTDDRRYATIVSTPGGIANLLAVIDLESPDWAPRVVVGELTDEWSVAGNTGTRFFAITTQGAERRKIVTFDLADPVLTFSDLIPEDAAVLNDAALLGGRLLVTYLDDVKTEIRRFTPAGEADGVVPLPGIGTAGGFRGRPDDNEAFFAFTSFNAPTTILRYDVAVNTTTVWAEPAVPVDLDQIVVEQRFAPSPDGAQIPVFIVRRRDVTAPAPTLLYAYGGFGISLLPYYSPSQIAWVEQGGVMAVANLRGGGEYGKAWHEAGRRQLKQNVFDDFIAAGEYLIAEGITPPDGLAIEGASNGGLLVGAVVNQRPELFAAALPGVGVMDMLRFQLFTGGKFWVDEYGDPSDEAAFRNLLGYSPYHGIQPGRAYPAVLVTTADTDDRVVPGHSFKYIAALQAADPRGKPHLARIETRAGHGSGKPLDKVIEETTDQFAFAAHWSGLDVAQPEG
ncbi:MAG: prolyl oligopeptidase family serine peptidase [Thermomicrobiales bacterium]